MEEVTEKADRNEICFINRKGGSVLLHIGYQYYKNKTFKNGSSVWTCCKKRLLKCRGSITIHVGKFVFSSFCMDLSVIVYLVDRSYFILHDNFCETYSHLILYFRLIEFSDHTPKTTYLCPRQR